MIILQKATLCNSVVRALGEDSDIVLQQRRKVFVLFAWASCLSHPNNAKRVGGKQEPHSSLEKRCIVRQRESITSRSTPTHLNSWFIRVRSAVKQALGGNAFPMAA